MNQSCDVVFAVAGCGQKSFSLSLMGEREFDESADWKQLLGNPMSEMLLR